ncbi:unnamed protein product [Prorocentrum cordatum]|uniref:Uncharacterized protein n=1 Tax=Prorocentrum cordatum TaxID=2364126 RepID=A0ABN9RQG4_9DINO|nr:unnamed protein product [Polarella glacialis]
MHGMHQGEKGVREEEEEEEEQEEQGTHRPRAADRPQPRPGCGRKVGYAIGTGPRSEKSVARKAAWTGAVRPSPGRERAGAQRDFSRRLARGARRGLLGLP